MRVCLYNIHTCTDRISVILANKNQRLTTETLLKRGTFKPISQPNLSFTMARSKLMSNDRLF